MSQSVFSRWNPYISTLVHSKIKNAIDREHKRLLLVAKRLFESGEKHVQINNDSLALLVLFPYFLKKDKVVIIAPIMIDAMNIANNFFGVNGSYLLDKNKEFIRFNELNRETVLPKGELIIDNRLPIDDNMELFVYLGNGLLHTGDVDLVILYRVDFYSRMFMVNLFNHYSNKQILLIN